MKDTAPLILHSPPAGWHGRIVQRQAHVEVIDLAEKFRLIEECWRPRIAAELNGQALKLVKVEGEFPWHVHEAADELFLVFEGSIRLEFRDRTLSLGPGQCALVPRGVEHRPVAERTAHILLFEPAETRNTGNLVDARYTAPEGVRV